MNINVSAEAVDALLRLSSELQEHSQALLAESRTLVNIFVEHEGGLGPHTGELASLMEELETLAAEADQVNRKLAKKARRAALIRRELTDNSPYRLEEVDPDEQYIPRVLGRMYDDLVRRRIHPKELGPDGSVRGQWQNQVFHMNDDFVPKNFNPEHKNVGQLRQELSQQYGIQWGGISYETGYADFESVSVARIGLDEIAQAHSGDGNPLSVDLEQMLADRETNFAIADAIAADKQLPIPGLEPGYTRDDLTQWRKENRFSWDESYASGYLLVPSVIHGNLSHTGLVSVGRRGTEAERNFAKRHGGSL